MKAKLFVLLALAAMSLAACHPNRMMRTILESDAKRSKMYHEILKNESYRAQLLDSIRTNQHTRGLLQSSKR